MGFRLFKFMSSFFQAAQIAFLATSFSRAIFDVISLLREVLRSASAFPVSPGLLISSYVAYVIFGIHQGLLFSWGLLQIC